MSDFKSSRLIPHILIIGGFMVLGVIVGIYLGSNLNVMFLIWITGALVDFLFYRQELLRIFTRKKPYVAYGIIEKKIKKQVIEGNEETDEFYFDLLIEEAYIISNKGKEHEPYYEKEGKHRVGVPESMFLSLKKGQEIHLVCEPDDYAWGLVRGDEVINIEV